jgi:hypothetical protein
MKKITYALTAGLLLVAGAAQAETYGWDKGGGTDTEWNNPLNWFGNVLPGYGTTNDIAVLGSSLIATVSSAVTSMVWDVTLVMRNGAKLEIADDMVFDLMRIGDTGIAGGDVDHSAGTVTASNCTVGIVTGSSYALSGSAGLALDADLSCGPNGLISLSGSSAAVTVGGNMSVQGSLAFALDDSGVNSINVASNLLVDANASLTVNASGYTGGAATFDLLTFATASGSFASNNITVLGAQSWSVGTDADSLFVTLVPYGPGDTFIIGKDDFDGSEAYADRTIINPLDNGNILFKIVNRDTIRTSYLIDTTVAAGGFVGLNPADTLGFLGTNKTDNILGMYRAGTTRALTYTFNIAGYTDLNLSMDWAASGSLADKGVSMSYSIDGAPATTSFVVGTGFSAWSETMDIGTVVNNAISGSVLVNGVDTNSLTDAFQTYTPTFDGTGSTLTLTFVMTSTAGGYGGMGMDNLKLYGTIPLPPVTEVGEIAIEAISAGTEVALTWPTELGGSYGVMARENLSVSSWNNIITNVPGTGSDVTVTNPVSANVEFYRAYLEE